MPANGAAGLPDEAGPQALLCSAATMGTISLWCIVPDSCHERDHTRPDRTRTVTSLHHPHERLCPWHTQRADDGRYRACVQNLDKLVAHNLNQSSTFYRSATDHSYLHALIVPACTDQPGACVTAGCTSARLIEPTHTSMYSVDRLFFPCPLCVEA